MTLMLPIFADLDATQWLYRVHAVTEAESKCVLWCGILTILAWCVCWCLLNFADKSLASFGAQIVNLCATLLWSSVESGYGIAGIVVSISDCFEFLTWLLLEPASPEKESNTTTLLTRLDWRTGIGKSLNESMLLVMVNNFVILVHSCLFRTENRWDTWRQQPNWIGRDLSV